MGVGAAVEGRQSLRLMKMTFGACQRVSKSPTTPTGGRFVVEQPTLGQCHLIPYHVMIPSTITLP